MSSYAHTVSRRSLLIGSAASLGACSTGTDASESHEAAARRIWRVGPLQGLSGAALSQELVRCATLAPSSHNTQCWKFAVEPDAISILPDLSRRCPVVDPDDHHLFVSLGCAAENLVQAAQAQGLRAEVSFEPARDAVRIALAPAAAETTALYKAMAQRSCTRGEYDGKPLSAAELKQLEAAGTGDRVRVLLLSDKAAMDNVLEFVIRGNTAQVNDKAFVAELKHWIRFNAADAVRAGDGLYTGSSGNPTGPAWFGGLMFNLFFTAGAENDKYAKHMRSSAGVAVFVAAKEDKAHWVEVGRAYERFALQAEVLGVRNAHLNMPVEVASIRPAFASALGIGAARPDLVIRFGRGPKLPASLRRPVQAVLA
jgi:hypothetical protein